MKAFLLGAAILLSLNLLSLTKLKPVNENPLPVGMNWQRSDKSIWKGSSNMWYKIDKKNMSVKLSSNKKKWKPGTNSIWMDNKGRYLFIYENKLMSSEDGSKWLTVQDNAWQGIDGTWYKFDEEWNLMEAKNVVNQNGF